MGRQKSEVREEYLKGEEVRDERSLWDSLRTCRTS